MTHSPQQLTRWIARFAMYGYPAALGLTIPHIISGVAPLIGVRLHCNWGSSWEWQQDAEEGNKLDQKMEWSPSDNIRSYTAFLPASKAAETQTCCHGHRSGIGALVQRVWLPGAA